MNIQENWLKFKAFVQEGEVVLVCIIAGVALGSFFLGRLSAQESPARTEQQAAVRLLEPPAQTETGEKSTKIQPTSVSVETEIPPAQDAKSVTPTAPPPQSTYVASKTGTKYHLPWCSGAQRIKEENKVWFATKAAAEAAGYEPAANCKGI